ncbi:MAG: metallophosphoesterase, partial [Proteobacteria bacterium]|nr:metallophosphoesterase [Pseudomonadota bacterium]
MTEIQNPDPDKTRSDSRHAAWRSRREKMEASRQKFTPLGNRKIKHWKDSLFLFAIFSAILRILGLYDRGLRNAADIRLQRIDLEFEKLPEQFEGFTILHISDLHLDRIAASIDGICKLLSEIDADVCVLTGDFQDDTELPSDTVMPMLAKLVDAMRVRDGVFGILGNHDRSTAVEALEEVGVSCLINESVSITRDGSKLYLTGTDDVHYFYTE